MRVPPGLRDTVLLAIIGLSQASCAGDHTGAASEVGPNFDCTVERSTPLDVPQFLAKPSSFSGKCVHARGYVVGVTFFESLDTFYASRSKSFPEGLIGLYEKPGFIGTNRRRYVDLTAFAFTCNRRNQLEDVEREREAAEAEARGEILVSADDSFCAFARGESPILYVSSMLDLPGAPTRLFGAEAERKYGTLTVVEDGWPYSEEVRNLVTEWIDAARNRRFDYWHIDRRDLRKLTDPSTSPIAFLFGASVVPRITYFRSKQPEDQFGYAAYGCVCRVGTCEGRWPVISDDAVLASDRPYFCLKVTRDTTLAESRPTINYVIE
jgi:hypothetical protein